MMSVISEKRYGYLPEFIGNLAKFKFGDASRSLN
jgi:hypothetical protein